MAQLATSFADDVITGSKGDSGDSSPRLADEMSSDESSNDSPSSSSDSPSGSGGDTDADIKTFEKYLFTSNFAVGLDIDKLDVYAEGMVKNAGYGSEPASEAVMTRRASMATVPAFAIGRVRKEDPMAGAHPLLLQQLGESVERQSVDGVLTA